MEETTPMKEAVPAREQEVKTVVVQRSSLAVPIAIVIGFALIAAAIYFGGNAPKLPFLSTAKPDTTDTASSTVEMRPVDEKDHIRGNPNAPIVIVEFSDYDCPFCKEFHSTLQQIMQNYGADGKVAWVYRNFPLQQLHPSAPYIAQAAECVAQLGGNDAFWKFTDLVFDERGTNEPTNTARLPEFAKTSGVSETAFNACLEKGDTKALVQEDFQEALGIGARGTPYSIVLVGGQKIVISGAQPYSSVSQLMDAILKQIEAKS
jgi:protein-disulfide isomerase